MTRETLVAANRTAATADAVTVVDLVAIQFPPPLGTLRLASGGLDVSWAGQTYLADGTLGASGATEETADLRPRTVRLTLSGARPELVQALRAGTWHYIRVDGWLGFVSPSGTLVADPYPIAPDLRASRASIRLDAGTASIDLELEGRELALLRDSRVLGTDANQRRRYSGDTGLGKVAAIADAQVQWGGKTQNVGQPPQVFEIPGRSIGRSVNP